MIILVRCIIIFLIAAGDKMNRYTFFVPRDSSFINLWPQDTGNKGINKLLVSTLDRK